MRSRLAGEINEVYHVSFALLISYRASIFNQKSNAVSRNDSGNEVYGKMHGEKEDTGWPANAKVQM